MAPRAAFRWRLRSGGASSEQSHAGQRLTNEVTDWESGGSVTRTEHYSYDDLNRLAAVDYGDPTNDETQSYSLDAMGNRLQKVDNITGTENRTYNAANMLLTRGSNSYSNDADGNTLSGAGRTNSWDSENRLVQCVDGSNTSQYTYGADGLRRRSIVNGTTTDTILDGSMKVRDLGYNNGVSFGAATCLIGLRGPEYRRSRRLSGPAG